MKKQFQEKSPLLSDPVDVAGKLVYQLPPRAKGTDRFPSCASGDPLDLFRRNGACSRSVDVAMDLLHDDMQRLGDSWMRMACETATTSVASQGGPFGAVVLQLDKETHQIIRYWANHNQVVLTSDPTAHAEIMAIRSACRSLGVFNLGEIRREDSLLEQPGRASFCVLYSSTEPCPMCYAAIFWARIPVMLFAATRFDAAAEGVGFSDEELHRELSVSYKNRKMRVYRCHAENAFDAFNLWKTSEKTCY